MVTFEPRSPSFQPEIGQRYWFFRLKGANPFKIDSRLYDGVNGALDRIDNNNAFASFDDALKVRHHILGPAGFNLKTILILAKP